MNENRVTSADAASAGSGTAGGSIGRMATIGIDTGKPGAGDGAGVCCPPTARPPRSISAAPTTVPNRAGFITLRIAVIVTSPYSPLRFVLPTRYAYLLRLLPAP